MNGTKGVTRCVLPDYATDIICYKENCVSCNLNAPCNPKFPPTLDPEPPLYPFLTI